MKHLLPILFLCACGAETEGQTISLDWQLAKASEEARSFTTDTGWTVTLDEASVAVESIFAIAPAAEGKSAVAWLSDLLVPVAHAHGGHDDANGLRVRAELLDPLVIDGLADADKHLEKVVGEAGDIATIKIELARPDSRLPESLHGFQAYARGTAEKDGVTVSFEGGLHIADQEPARRIETKVDFTLSQGGTLTLAVHPEAWFRDAEFDRLAAADGGERQSISASDQVGRAWGIGVRSPDAFEIRWNRGKD